MAFLNNLMKALAGLFASNRPRDKRAADVIKKQIGPAAVEQIQREATGKAGKRQGAVSDDGARSTRTSVSSDYDTVYKAGSSSNVYAFWLLRPEKGQTDGTLVVQFLGGSGKQRGGPGPVYGYRGVSVAMFRRLVSASSKGKFVWDNLRVRGTIFDHQTDYFYISNPAGYAPRKATSKGFNPRPGSNLGGTGRYAGRGD